MKREFFLIYLLFVVCSLSGQSLQIEMTSFSKDELSQTAKIASVKDENGAVCGLLKIKSTELNDLLFTTGKNGQGRAVFSEINEANAVILLYVSPSTRYLNVVSKSGRFNMYQYLLPEGVESEMVYNLELQVHNPNNTIVVKQAVQTENFVNVVCTTPFAELVLNDDTTHYALHSGNLQLSLPYGRYHYALLEPTGKYHPLAGDFEITDSAITQLKVSLPAAYGSVEITSFPEDGAHVFINNDDRGVTPLILNEVKSGALSAYLQQDYYKAQKVDFVVNDNDVTRVDVTMEPLFAAVTFTCADSEAEIYIQNQLKGKGSWSGRLVEGQYVVECRRTSYVSSKITFQAVPGESKREELEAPVPITGVLQITTNVDNVQVYVDGELAGVAPLRYTGLIGNHHIRFYKTGFGAVSNDVLIAAGESQDVYLPMVENSKCVVNVVTDAGCEIYVDDRLLGVETWEGELAAGSYVFALKSKGATKKVTKKVDVTDNSGVPNRIKMPYWGHVVIRANQGYVDCKVSGGYSKLLHDDVSEKEYLVEPNTMLTFKVGVNGGQKDTFSYQFLPGETQVKEVNSAETVDGVLTKSTTKTGKYSEWSNLFFNRVGHLEMTWLQMNLDYASATSQGIWGGSIFALRYDHFYLDWLAVAFSMYEEKMLYNPSIGYVIPVGHYISCMPFLQIGVINDKDVEHVDEFFDTGKLYGSGGVSLRFQFIKFLPFDCRLQFSSKFGWMFGVNMAINSKL